MISSIGTFFNPLLFRCLRVRYRQACTDLDTLTQQATLTSSATAEADAKAQINETISR